MCARDQLALVEQVPVDDACGRQKGVVVVNVNDTYLLELDMVSI